MTAVAEATGLLPPLSDAIITAVSRLVDDRDNRRDPSHADLTSHVRRAGLATANLTTPAGKEKRIPWGARPEPAEGQEAPGDHWCRAGEDSLVRPATIEHTF
jgi:hypothetical protein